MFPFPDSTYLPRIPEKKSNGIVTSTAFRAVCMVFAEQASIQWALSIPTTTMTKQKDMEWLVRVVSFEN
jgi:hypothetical protein